LISGLFVRLALLLADRASSLVLAPSSGLMLAPRQPARYWGRLSICAIDSAFEQNPTGLNRFGVNPLLVRNVNYSPNPPASGDWPDVDTHARKCYSWSMKNTAWIVVGIVLVGIAANFILWALMRLV
jgi:hypothetical protein